MAIALLLTSCTTPASLPQPASSTPFGIHPSPSTIVAEVDGEAIYREEWQRALALDRAMSALAGRSLPTPEESLQRLINERLTLREAHMASFTATPDQAAARLQTLLRRWNKDELALDAALAEHDLSRADVLDAIRRLLIVESYFAHLGSEAEVQRWMAERRQRARVGLYVSFSVPPTPSVLTAALPKLPATPLVLAPQVEPTVSTPSLQPVYERAPDSTIVPSSTPPPENPALDFTLPDLDGRPTTLSQFRGRIVVLNFWASWCPSCRAEARDFGDFARQYRDRGVTVVGVNLREDAATVRNFAESNGMDYPLLLDADGAVGRMYEVVGIPTTIVIDAAGGVRGRHVGVLNAAQLAAYVAPLLTDSPSTERLAPDFTLPREDGRLVSLRDYLGRQPVVLLFYRSAGCGSCQQQLRAMQAEYGRFRARGAEVLAIAVQGVTQASVVRELGQLEFPVLADEAHTVSEAFGVFNQLGDGLAAPSVFVIDEGGRIIWSHIGRDVNDYPAPSDILNRVS
ncbi:MAG: redoxin domain-containing protein [Candidatus Brachytrichaceae bacterium NZ_4S206]